MTQYAVALNEDVNGVKTTAEWDGTQWLIPIAGSVASTAEGAVDDTAVTNPALDGTNIALLKGVLTLLAALNVDVGESADAAVTNPASSASSIAALKGVLSLLTALNVDLGEAADAAVSNPASSGSVIATNKGILTLLAALNVDVGEAADAAVTNPASSGSQIALLKGLLTKVNYTSGDASPATIKTAALAASLVVKASAGKLRSIVGYSTTGQFIQIHNTTSLPADTAVPEVVIPIEASKPFSIDFGDVGLPCSTGIVVCNSTTGATKTIGASDMFVTAVYQ